MTFILVYAEQDVKDSVVSLEMKDCLEFLELKELKEKTVCQDPMVSQDWMDWLASVVVLETLDSLDLKVKCSLLSCSKNKFYLCIRSEFINVFIFCFLYR